MKTRSIITILLCGIFISLSAQSTNFRFDVDNQVYLQFKTNTAGFHYIEQTNTQTSLFFGYRAGVNNTDIGGTNYGEFNSAFGQLSLSSNTSGQRNTALGYSCIDENTTGNSNVGIGYAALSHNTEGDANIAIGSIALRDNTTGDNNIAVGANAILTTNGTGNTSMGWSSGTYGSANFNTYFGYRAGRGPVNTTTSRSNNVLLGAYAGEEVTTSGNVMLGYKAGRYSNAAGSQLYIANSDADSTAALIYGKFDDVNTSNQLVRINGQLTVNGLYTMPTTAPVSGQFLRATATGANPTLSWANIDAPWSLAAEDDVLYEDGDVGIGLGNALYRLDVEDSNTSYVARFRNSNTTSNSRGIIIQAGPTTNPTSSTYYTLCLDGNGTNIGGIRGNGSGGLQFATTSDRRLKQNIKTYTDGLKTVMEIRPTQYQMKSNPSVDEIGFIAQELKKILPLAVGGNPTDNVKEAPMTVDYSRLTPVLVAAIQEQQQIIKALQKQLDSQNQKFEKQDQQYADLKAEIMKMQGLANK